MQKKTRSLLQELEFISHDRDMNHIIENRANNIIISAINLIELMKKHYTTDKVELLEKKLLSSIKNRTPEKFSKTMRSKK